MPKLSLFPHRSSQLIDSPPILHSSFLILHFFSSQPFLLRAAPSLVSPEPEVRILYDVLFQQTHVKVSCLIVGHRLKVVHHLDEVAVVIATARTSNTSVHDVSTQAFCDVFRADENRRFVIEERREMMNGFPLRLLVGDESANHLLTTALQLPQPAVVSFMLMHSPPYFSRTFSRMRLLVLL